MGKSTFWSDFKKFISKGNVIDMAVGVVIGGSFGRIITAIVEKIINPFIGIFMKEGNLSSIKTVISNEVVDNLGNVETPEVAILWGDVLQTILDFLITALCIFIVLRAIMKVQKIVRADELEKQAAEAEKKKQEEEKKKAEAEAEKKALEERKLALEEATLNSEKLLAEISELLRKNR